MKKIIAIIMMTAMLIAFSGCNYNVVDTKWNFNTAYINYGDKIEKVEVQSWAEDETTFTIQTVDGRVICTHQMNVVLTKE